MATRILFCKVTNQLAFPLINVRQSLRTVVGMCSARPFSGSSQRCLQCDTLQSVRGETQFINNRLQTHYFYQCVRYYAKSKDKKKSDKGQKRKVQVNEELLAEVINVPALRDQMQSTIDKLKEDYTKNLSLRSASGSIESLPITFEGKNYILQELAQVVRKNPKTVVINMTAFPQVIPTVLQAIAKSGMNLNPQQDGTSLFIPIPKVTKEHRETLSKNAKALFISCRDNIKDVQNKFQKSIKNKEKDGLAKDIAQIVSEYVEYTASEHISTAEKIMEAKQQELIKET